MINIPLIYKLRFLIREKLIMSDHFSGQCKECPLNITDTTTTYKKCIEIIRFSDSIPPYDGRCPKSLQYILKEVKQEFLALSKMEKKS